MSQTHRHHLRVYYEDTDLAGIVYYANYLKFIERGRSEWVREFGIDQAETAQGPMGIVFAVRRVEADYLRPATFGDDLIVTTDHCQAKYPLHGSYLKQQVLRGSEDHTLFLNRHVGLPEKTTARLLESRRRIRASATGEMAK